MNLKIHSHFTTQKYKARLQISARHEASEKNAKEIMGDTQDDVQRKKQYTSFLLYM